MKKLIVGLIAALFLGASVVSSVKAQNVPSGAITSYGNLVPALCSNSTGANYGCIYNTGPNTWALGSGPSLVSLASATYAFQWGSSGSSSTISFGTTSGANSATLVTQSTSATTASFTAQTSDGLEAFSVNGDGGTQFRARTLAQLQALAPIEVGENFFCSNCSPVKNVVSTGTSAGNFADPAGGQFK